MTMVSFLTVSVYTPEVEPAWHQADNYSSLVYETKAEKNGLLQKLFGLGRR